VLQEHYGRSSRFDRRRLDRPVRGRDLVREGEDEVPVAIELRSRRFALKQRHRVVEVLESVAPELLAERYFV
jgi:hypothetical protein